MPHSSMLVTKPCHGSSQFMTRRYPQSILCLENPSLKTSHTQYIFQETFPDPLIKLYELKYIININTPLWPLFQSTLHYT